MIAKDRVGKIVFYRMSDDTLDREAALDVDHNKSAIGDLLPMLITSDWGGAVNGTLFLDGEVTLWMTSVVEGHLDGQFQMPAEQLDGGLA